MMMSMAETMIMKGTSSRITLPLDIEGCNQSAQTEYAKNIEDIAPHNISQGDGRLAGRGRDKTDGKLG